MKPQLRRPLIAVVDDDPSIRTSLTRLLQLMGFYAQYFKTGAEFLFSLGNRVPDCLLLDVFMPEADGLQILEYLNRMNVTLPIILATGTHDEDILRRASMLGVKEVLSKPYCLDALTIKINKMLGCPGYLPTRCPWPCPAIGKGVWNCAFSGFEPEDRRRLNAGDMVLKSNSVAEFA